jgi:polyphosphate glucokinase
MKILGVDIGGSGIKAAPVDVARGRLLAERHRIPTPQPASPDAVGDVVAELVRHFGWKGAIGCAFPAAVKKGVALTAANVDETWIGTNAEALFRKKTGYPVVVLNDADAAGIAEVKFGAGKDQEGVVIVVTLGTGIGSALFVDGRLLPNTELGHLRIRGKDAEQRASDRAREEKGWTWKQWAKRLNEYLGQLEALFFPDLFILGGGVSKKHEKFLPLLETRARVVPAEMLNEAGIVGAALAARDLG